jgi:hypothetical protein
MLEPAVQVLKPPIVHPDLATLVALPVPDQHRPARRVDIRLAQRQRLGDPQSCAPQHGDHRPDAQAVAVSAGQAHDGDDLLDPGWVSRIFHSLVARHAAGEIAGQRRVRAPPPDSIDQNHVCVWHDSSSSGSDPRSGPPGPLLRSSRRATNWSSVMTWGDGRSVSRTSKSRHQQGAPLERRSGHLIRPITDSCFRRPGACLSSPPAAVTAGTASQDPASARPGACSLSARCRAPTGLGVGVLRRSEGWCRSVSCEDSNVDGIAALA